MRKNIVWDLDEIALSMCSLESHIVWAIKENKNIDMINMPPSVLREIQRWIESHYLLESTNFAKAMEISNKLSERNVRYREALEQIANNPAMSPEGNAEIAKQALGMII